ncbi:MAG TPA: alpha/beta hydrolase [Cyclobacteriaceae bacterium]
MALSQEVLNNIAYAEEKGFNKLHLLPPAQTRAFMKQVPKNPNPTPVAKVIDMVIPDADIPVRIYTPEGTGPFPMISYFHGGGFVLMSIDTHDEISRQLSKKTGAIVMSVEYRLAPEHPFPAGPQDSLIATQWMIQNAQQFNGITSKVAVAGDSAGGYMALYVAQKLAAEGIKLSAQVVVYPVIDHYTNLHASWEENKTGYILTAEMMRWFWDNFISDKSKFNKVSLLGSTDFSGLPPALIMTANYDPLRDEGKAYADKLMAAKVEAVYKNYENVHGFFGTGEMGQQAMDEAVTFLRNHFNNG